MNIITTETNHFVGMARVESMSVRSRSSRRPEVIEYIFELMLKSKVDFS